MQRKKRKRKAFTFIFYSWSWSLLFLFIWPFTFLFEILSYYYFPSIIRAFSCCCCCYCYSPLSLSLLFFVCVLLLVYLSRNRIPIPLPFPFHMDITSIELFQVGASEVDAHQTVQGRELKLVAVLGVDSVHRRETPFTTRGIHNHEQYGSNKHAQIRKAMPKRRVCLEAEKERPEFTERLSPLLHFGYADLSGISPGWARKNFDTVTARNVKTADMKRQWW